jgi:NTE family protein
MNQTTNKKVGLALGGGYARGLAHIGVLEVLEREGIPVDLIAGTSAGALVGALYATEMDAAVIRQQAGQMDWVGLTSLIDLSIHRSGFLAGRKVSNLLKRLMGDVNFKDLKIPLSCVATDIMTGDQVSISEGSVLDAVRASISIPVVFTVAKNQGRYLVDGGLVNPVPVSVAKEMGADFIIAVDVTPDKAERAAHITAHETSREPGFLQVIVQAIYISTYYTAHTVSEGADVIIHPHLAHVAPGEFHRAPEIILEGELTAIDSMAILKKKLRAAGITLKPARNTDELSFGVSGV